MRRWSSRPRSRDGGGAWRLVHPSPTRAWHPAGADVAGSPRRRRAGGHGAVALLSAVVRGWCTRRGWRRWVRVVTTAMPPSRPRSWPTSTSRSASWRCSGGGFTAAVAAGGGVGGTIVIIIDRARGLWGRRPGRARAGWAGRRKDGSPVAGRCWPGRGRYRDHGPGRPGRRVTGCEAGGKDETLRLVERAIGRARAGQSPSISGDP